MRPVDRLVVLASLVAACGRPAPPKSDPPASVSKKTPEGEIARVMLTPAAEERLGVVLDEVKRTRVPKTRSVGGEIVPSSGRSIIVSAPVAGRVVSAMPGGVRAGQMVSRGDAMLRLTPVASVDRDVRSQGERAVSAADARLSAAEARFSRTEKLLADGAASARAFEEARADRDVARADRDAAKSRLDMLERAPLEADVAVTLRAPEDGVVRLVSVGSVAMVAAGAPLFELVGTNALWVKANVFVGDVRDIRVDASARIRGLTAPPKAGDPEALPISGPPTADSLTSTFDLYYALPKETGFHPGERVAVTLAYRGDDNALSVPATSIVRDTHGVAWVYESVAEHAYERRRVEIDRVVGAEAILARGLREQVRIVATGASELYGFEFTGK